MWILATFMCFPFVTVCHSFSRLKAFEMLSYRVPN
jgi:hypothetical protein